MNSENLANKIRINCVEMASSGGGSHIGSALSIADILACLYSDILNVFPNDPKAENRDRFILSKGHAGAAVYSVLSEVGFFSTDKLKTHYKDGSDLSGHVSHKKIPGVELSTGSLGHGLNVGVGMAKAAKLNKKDHKIVVLLSDGECDEGTVWEAALFSSHHKLNNLIAIIDYNKLQSLDTIENTLGLEPFKQKWESFGWETINIDGHNHSIIKKTFSNLPVINEKPIVIIADTTKGKGVSFMENSVLWHYRSPQGEEFKKAIKELKKK
ncbi:transketolase [Candidatus Marinimicrobia bacterium]|jgi:transketolase|nr:transketolase [Candidatus Neomarinimicrobiota bacterium]